MKATGIVRRIDDLGRVVIPKEIRRVMGIKEGDPIEIFTDYDSNGRLMVCLLKYDTSFLPSLTAMADAIHEEMSGQWWSKRGEVRDHFEAIAKLLKEFEES